MSTDPCLILVLNSGSSSLKFAVHDTGMRTPLISGLAERLGTDGPRITFKDVQGKRTESLPASDHAAALDAVLAELTTRNWIDALAAVGHRVVHGGERFTSSALVTPAVLADIEAVSPLAPLHNPAALLGLRTALARLPNIPHVTVFDTAFHQSMAPEAYLYAVPTELYRQQGVRRYGFHGTSHRFVARETVAMLGLEPGNHGLVIAHLGNGASATAVQDGHSMDTTMGMTPLEGLVMGTRSGDIDVGAVLHLMRTGDRSAADIDTLLNKQSGLLGVSGLTNDCRELESAAEAGHPGARLALDVFVHRLVRHIGGLAMALRRLDAIVFTGGIGENSARVRAMTVARLRLLGLELDPAANAAMVGGAGGVISSNAEGPRAVVVPTNEEWMIACDTAELARRATETGSLWNFEPELVQA
ncbi:propionate kinase [Rhodovastum atsumiense]|uniref:Acetate kinase n=1 Tax=Rhodovastum atsumiense TaxID=504468 RepID=A0A5M6IZ13_9PROT|nr:acetate kinase [Rhodovastum atsumiense]KAA5613531.1 acetate kinase [Rhodovastum atsumiense]CAH2603281.1 propionate kinase [Rhodovastum atsumiense]